MLKHRIILGSFALVIVLCIHSYWFTKSYDANATTFDHTISAALYEAGDTISGQVVVEKKSANYFYVTSKTAVTSKTVDTLIEKAFAERNIDLDYEIGVYNAADDSLIYVTQKKASESPKDITPVIESDGVQKNFAVMFPTRNNFLIGQSDLWSFAIGLAILLVWIASQWITFRKSASTELNPSIIQLGRCTLDFHNQQLTVGKATFELTYKENQMLKLFFENPNQVLERDIFLKEVWEKDGFFVARSMDVFISRIRKYLQSDASMKIENLRAIGYRLNVRE